MYKTQNRTQRTNPFNPQRQSRGDKPKLSFGQRMQQSRSKGNNQHRYSSNKSIPDQIDDKPQNEALAQEVQSLRAELYTSQNKATELQDKLTAISKLLKQEE